MRSTDKEDDLCRFDLDSEDVGEVRKLDVRVKERSWSWKVLRELRRGKWDHQGEDRKIDRDPRYRVLAWGREVGGEVMR